MANAAYRTSSFGDTHFGTRTNTTLTPGVTAASGELLCALFYQNNITTAPVTPPSGWTEHAESPITFGGADARVRFYYKIAGGSEASSYTWTHNSNTTYGAIWIVQNVNPTNVIDCFNFGTTTAGQDPNTSDTTTEANVLLFACFTYTSNAGTTTEPAGFTEVGDDVNTFGVAHKLQASAGATGTITYDTTVNDNTILVIFGVKSEAAAGTPVAVFRNHYRLMERR